jgi:hypothetical protein
MTKFWSSLEKLTDEGLKLAWFGIAISCLGQVLANAKWLSWFGIGATVIALVLRHRTEHLKHLQAMPRTLTELQTTQILNGLKDVPKQALTVGFFGQDVEAEQFAGQIKQVLEKSGFPVVRLEGFMVFKLHYGLTITAFNSDSQNPAAIGIQKVFRSVGLEIEFESNLNRMDPPISLNVHGKPPNPGNPALGQPLSHPMK